MHILNDAISKYLSELTSVDNPVLKEIEEYGKKNDFPIVGPVVGTLIMQLAKIIGAKRIIELGSGFGYSAAWFLQALPVDGEIICTEYSDENISRGIAYLNDLSSNGRARFVKGDALEILKNTHGQFDIIFNDIDKKDYSKAFEQSIPRLRRGGLFIADNALWKGQVAEKNPDETTRAIQNFNELIYSSSEVISTIIPLRDGVSVSLKL